MKEPERKSVPVDPNKPEQPIALLMQAVQYLMDECGRWNQLADAAVESKTPYPQSVLVGKLAERIGQYRSRGLEALARIAEDLAKEHNARVEAAEKAAAAKPKEEPAE